MALLKRCDEGKTMNGLDSWESIYVCVGVALCGGVVGRILTALVPPLFCETTAPQIKRVQIRNCWEQMPIIGTLFIKKNGPEKRLWSWIEISAIAIGGGMAWWEIVARSQLPLEFFAHEQGAPVLRVFAHLVLFGFMAAATWSDLLHRVIPDAITVPGTLLGLLCVWAFPEILLPIGCEQARSYATPKLVLDVLGPAGGLQCVGMPDGYTAAPQWMGLLMSLGLFFFWWVICTVADARRAILHDPRTWLLAAGAVFIVGAWWWGTEAFVSLETSLIGVGVSMGLVLAVRSGASHALGREAMGLGDATLMATIGAWLGWQAGVIIFFMAAFIGLLWGTIQWLKYRGNELPYGPSLCLAAVACVFFWRLGWYRVSEFFADPILLIGVVVVVVIATTVTLMLYRMLGRGNASEKA